MAKELTSQSVWRSLKHAFVLDNSAPRKRQRKPIAVDISSPTLAAGDLGIICWVLEVLALSRTRIDYEIASEMRQFWDEVLGDASAVEKHFRCSRDVARATWLLSLSIGVMKSSSTLAEFFHAFGKDGDTAWTVSPRDFTERVLAFIQPTSSTKRNKSNSASARHVLLTTVCIQLLGDLSQCVGIELPEVHVDQIGNFLRDAVVTASANATVHAIGLQYCALSTVSKLGSAMRSNFVEATLKVSVFFVRHCRNGVFVTHSFASTETL